MKTSNGTRYFWAAAAAILVTGFLHSESDLTSSRALLREQAMTLRNNDELKAELYRLRSELAEAQAEARAYKQLYNDADRAR